VLVANTNTARRLDSSGNIVQTYTPTPSAGLLFALNLDPDGTSFWTADIFSTEVYKFDIATGNQLFNFNAQASEVAGVAVFGELTAARSPQITIVPANFPGNPTNLNCPTKNIQITNNGPGDLVVHAATSSNTSLFTVVSLGTCAAPVAEGQSCNIAVQFTPPSVGDFNATVTVESNAVGTPHQVVISGTGTPPCQLLTRARTARVVRGTEATSLEVSDATPSCSPVPLNLTCTPENPAACALNPAVIPPSGTSLLTVRNLAAVGADQVRVLVNATSEFRSATEQVTVLIADFAFTTAPASATIQAGETATYAVALRPIHGLTGPVTLACTGAPRGATCTVSPSTVMLDGASLAQATVRVATTARATGGPGRRHFPLPPLGRHQDLLLLLGLGMLLLAWAKSRRVDEPRGAARPASYGRRDRRRHVAATELALAVALVSVLAWTACGGGGTSVSFRSGGTPAGTFTLTIKGTYSTAQPDANSSFTQTTPLSLTVR
jgi:hypothetical protein